MATSISSAIGTSAWVEIATDGSSGSISTNSSYPVHIMESASLPSAAILEGHKISSTVSFFSLSGVNLYARVIAADGNTATVVITE